MSWTRCAKTCEIITYNDTCKVKLGINYPIKICIYLDRDRDNDNERERDQDLPGDLEQERDADLDGDLDALLKSLSALSALYLRRFFDL